MANLKLGSSGSDVKKLQEKLVKAGYSVGSAGADGVYGKDTEAAVKKYQENNGLKVDGIVGNNTLASLSGINPSAATFATLGSKVALGAQGAKPAAPKPAATTPTPPATTPKPTATTPTTPTSEATNAAPPAADTPVASTPSADAPAASTQPFTYDDFAYADYAQSDIVKQANALLQQQMASKPGAYQSKWESYLNDYMNKIENRDPFSYDFNSDALYNQYKDQYIQQGQMAMMDTMGQAAAMTGGYGNSYAQTVGQQAYNQQLNQLNNIMPELYGMAYDKYQQEGQDLLNMYGMYLDRENQDYGRYQDELGNWYTQLQYLTDQYNAERDYDYGKWLDNRNLAYDNYLNAIDMEYKQGRDAIADAQWQAQFDEGVRQYEQQRADSLAAAKSSRSSSLGNSVSNTTYRKTDIDDDKYYSTLFANVKDQEALDALAQRMDAQGYDPDYIDAFYSQYSGTFGPDVIDTYVPLTNDDLKGKSKGKGYGGGRTYYAVK